MPKALRILFVEDSENDAELLLRELRKGGFAPEHSRVDTEEAMRAALASASWDIIISDYSMPHFDGISALNVMKHHGKDIPFIIVSANIGEEIAVMAMKAGAHDYIMKDWSELSYLLVIPSRMNPVGKKNHNYILL